MTFPIVRASTSIAVTVVTFAQFQIDWPSGLLQIQNTRPAKETGTGEKHATTTAGTIGKMPPAKAGDCAEMLRLWHAGYERLDRPWKRVGFLLWMPFLVATVLVSAYAMYNVYMVYVESTVFVCHRNFAGFVEGRSFPDENNMRALAIAHERANSRFSSDTRQVEALPEFTTCMTEHSPYGSYWINYWDILHTAAASIFWTSMLALIIFPRFWSKIANWIAMTPDR